MVKVGRIDTRAEPFSSTYRRTTSQHFNVNDFRAVSGGFAFRDHDAGIELWGAATGPDNGGGIEYAAGIVQGTAGRAETNNCKAYYGTVTYKIGGHGVVGPRDEITEPEKVKEYRESSLSVGVFAYKGKGQPPIIPGIAEDGFSHRGIKIDAWIKNVNIFGAVVRGEDELRGSSLRKIRTSAIMVEADYPVLPWVMPLFRFEKTNDSDGRRSVIQMVPAVNLLVRANVRVLAEGHFFNRVGDSSTVRTGLNEGVIRLDFLF